MRFSFHYSLLNLSLILAVGGYDPSSANYQGVKAELYNNQANKWRSINNYPFTDELIRFASLYLTGSFYVIGGQSVANFLPTIAKLDTASWSWSLAGHLKIGCPWSAEGSDLTDGSKFYG